MLSLQGSLFENPDNMLAMGVSYLDEGCYSTVYSSASRPDMVIKQCCQFDGSLAWLMFCERNQGRKGVPVIESLVLTLTGYVCTMKRYDSMKSGEPRAIKREIERPGYWRRRYDMDGKYVEVHGPGTPTSFGTFDHPGTLPEYAYLNDLEADFERATGLEWTDVHHGNYMWCTETQSIVMTDPSAGNCFPGEVRRSLDNWSTVEPFALTMQ